ncbi:MAG: cell division protein ZapE [Steroidobacteraceae bacterium]
MTQGPTLVEVYDDLLASGEMLPDAAQRAAMLHLDALWHCLQRRPAAGGWLQRMGLRRAADCPCRGLYLWGGVGRGKTWLVDEFCHLLPASSTLRLHFQHFMRDIHASLNQLRQRDRPLEILAGKIAADTQVLCLDEFQVLDIADAMILYGLIAALLQRGVVLVVTSNTPPERLYEGGLQRERFLPAIALLQQHMDVVEIGAGPDYRLQELTDSGTWFDSAQPDAGARMEALFRRLAGAGPVQENVPMHILGRTLQALRTAPGMAWFPFSALCEGPRGAEDYLTLAGQLHTLFLSDVPVFDDTRNDAARRFISLIDEMYDRDVSMVISAAAGPLQLYRGVRLAGPFERTASRLTEMRGGDYLARAQPIARERARR